MVYIYSSHDHLQLEAICNRRRDYVRHQLPLNQKLQWNRRRTSLKPINIPKIIYLQQGKAHIVVNSFITTL
ncbi:unnamed protein product [Haemonchus placei]|uniref:Uncharacterized protein n=1 Tax=Haemonchus placei TaxID=6290 RepID=A0A0N4VVG4_HAEPC|nr:unnamed protein product [Haemonchus placei]